MTAPHFRREVCFLLARSFMRRGKRKTTQGLYQEKRVDVLENSHPVLSKMMSYFRSCDMRRHKTNKYH